MGAQESTSRSKETQLEIGKECSSSSGLYKVWDHVNSCTKNRKIKGTLFTKRWDGSDHKKFIENGVRLLKQLRHPGIVTFLECSQQSDSLSLMTEQVQVLDLCIDSLPFIEIHSGLCQILKVLVFLHSQATIAHNNLSPSFVFVSSNGEWKLGGFELAQSSDHEDHLFFKSKFYEKVKSDQFLLKSAKNGIERDTFAFGQLIEFVLKHVSEEDHEATVKTLQETADRLIRLETDLFSLTDNHIFSNDLTQITDFFGSIQIKSKEQKDSFYSEIEERLRSLPPQVVARRLCRLAVSRYVILEPLSHTHVYPTLLVPAGEETKGILPLDLYKNYLIPELVRIFAVKDTSVRLGLLAHFDQYLPYIPANLIEGFVMDEVLIGTRDVDDRLVAASLRAMADLISVLGAAKVCDWKLSKIFADGTAKCSSNASSRPSISENRPPPRVEPITRSLTTVSQQDSGYSSTISPLKTVETYPEAPDSQADWGEENDWSENWNTPVEEYRAEETSEPAETLPKPTTTVKSVVRKENSIGSSLEIKVMKKEEDDFFADMAPKINTAGTLIDKLIALKEKEEADTRKGDTLVIFHEQEDTEQSSKFAMSTDLDAEASWGDDGAWDEEETATVEETELEVRNRA